MRNTLLSTALLLTLFTPALAEDLEWKPFTPLKPISPPQGTSFWNHLQQQAESKKPGWAGQQGNVVGVQSDNNVYGLRFGHVVELGYAWKANP